MESKETKMLRAAYRELELEARDYADPATVAATVRRRRARRATVTAVLAMVTVAGVVGYGPWRSSQAGPVTAVMTSATAEAAPGTAGPLTVRPPASASPLPEGTAGASGLLVYTSCTYGCPTYLVLADGRQRLLGEQTVFPPGNITLSPDGRWLGLPIGAGYELRDLIGDAVHVIDAPPKSAPGAVYSPWAWSADGRRLVLGHHTSGDVGAYAQVDPADGTVTALRLPSGSEPLGMLASGEPLLFDESRYGKRSAVIELTVGRTGRRITLDAGSTPLVTANGGPAIQVRGERVYAVAPDLTVVIAFDLDGRELYRLPLSPGETPLAPIGDGFGVLTESALELRTDTGTRTLYDLPKDVQMVLPGQARH
ncbi:hypothetical protein ACFLIM_44965 [Nonomuraea sp. M3C6]|uniref:WD40-like Beta Propeller Repeat n=1 Tax=Nonomuraea marmarensis TaxID=3351344 RepID=A0ABW7ASE7_9ACTN